MPHLIDTMRMAGIEHKPFDFVLNDYNILGLNKSQKKTLQDAYTNGVMQRLRKDDYFPRLVIEIVYPDNVIKTQEAKIHDASKYALSDYRYAYSHMSNSLISVNPLNIDPLNIDPFTDAIILTGLTYDNFTWRFVSRFATRKIMEFSKDFMLKKKCIWAGQIFVAVRYPSISKKNSLEAKTANSPERISPMIKNDNPDNFDSPQKKVNTLRSILCEIKENKLVVTNMSNEKHPSDAIEFYKSAFKKFRTRFNEFLARESEHWSSISLEDLNSD